MNPERRQTVLAALGVVQYRERQMHLASSDRAQPVVEGLVGSVSANSDVATNTSTVKSKPSIASSIDELAAVMNDLDGDTAPAPASESTEESNSVEKIAEVANDLSRSFDLRFWRCGHLLVVETQSTIALEEQANDTEPGPEVAHRLVNNVFRALFGGEASGASMYTHSWPQSSIVGSPSDDSAAQEWLGLFLKGQIAKDPDTKLWLMGNDGLELLLAEHGSPNDLQEKQVVHKQLDLEVYVTASLSQIAASPRLKASIWQLLRSNFS